MGSFTYRWRYKSKVVDTEKKQKSSMLWKMIEWKVVLENYKGQRLFSKNESENKICRYYNKLIIASII